MMTTTSQEQRARQLEMYRTACAKAKEQRRLTCPDILPATRITDEFHVMAAPIAQGGGQVLSKEQAREIYNNWRANKSWHAK